MPEEKKEKIMQTLSKFPDDKLTISKLNELIDEISYPTLLKWVMVLEAEGKIKVDDYGNIKFVYLNKEYENE